MDTRGEPKQAFKAMEISVVNPRRFCNSVAGMISYRKLHVNTAVWFTLQQQGLTQGLAPARTFMSLTMVIYAVARMGATCSAPI